MAKGKKKEVLTLEERLQAALVPESEQPYRVPGNWCWIYALVMFDVEYGKGLSTKDLSESGYPVFGANGQIGFYKEYMFEEIKALMSCRGAYSGTMNLSLPKAFVTSNSLVINSKNNAVSERFIFYLYSALDKTSLISGSAQPQVTVQAFSNYFIPFPPLSEQQRIVECIESLFAKLDEARQKVQDVLDSFESRKAAILHKAFSGELTVQWRKEHGVRREEWRNVSWGTFITLIEAGRNWNAEGRPPKNDEFGVVKVSAVTWGEFNELESKTCTCEKQWNENVQIHTGDFLFSRANTLQLVGNCVIVKDISKRLMLSDKILRFTFDNSVVPGYILNFTRSDLYRKQIEQLASGNQDGMRNVSQKNMKLVEFPIPELNEQTEIVRILDSFFAKEQQAKEASETVLEQIDLIKKSILARAFRGELGTNDPAEESALELIKQILSETIANNG